MRIHQSNAWLVLSGALLVLQIVSLSVLAEDKYVIGSPGNTSFCERLAAQELQRYIYVRTGELLPITDPEEISNSKYGGITIGRKNQSEMQKIAHTSGVTASVASLGAQDYYIRTIHQRGKKNVMIVGGGDAGVLFGAYRFAEHLGVRFYLHGDVIPGKQVRLALPDINELRQPLFNLRGIHPFHDFPEGPDWWNIDDYKAVISQLPKLGMNFFALHTYPENHPNAEPTVWIGTEDDIAANGKVRFSYPSSYQNTQRGNWGYEEKKTSRYSHGSAELFPEEIYGPDVMAGHFPSPQEPEDCNEVFERTGLMLGEAFRHAQSRNIDTCVGTEIPLTIPERVRENLKAAGKDPDATDTIKELYKGIFKRIKQTYPLDYYWLWTPEGWTWRGNSQEELDKTKNDLLAAVSALRASNAPFKLATCGWVLGPQEDRAMFDRLLPKSMPMSCINREVGMAPVEPGFADVQGRPKWAIPWLEDDPALTSPQLWVGRMRADAADALKYRCTGLMGIHWRTRILGPNVSALAKAAWDQSSWQNMEDEAPVVKPKDGPIDGNTASFDNVEIEGTNNDALYQTVRWNVTNYKFEVPNGFYDVVLCFSESHYDEPGKRVFDITLEHKTVLEAFDIIKEAGKSHACDKTFQHISVSDGKLDIGFVSRAGETCISAISITNRNTKKKINCGGPKFKDYEADPATLGKPSRDRETYDFYFDWANSQFGPVAAKPVARLFTELDGKLPRTSEWVKGPGGLNPDTRPWSEVSEDYDFVDRFAVLRHKAKGKAEEARFEYWLNTFQYQRAAAKVRCKWAEMNTIMKMIEEESDFRKSSDLAKRKGLPLRRELVRSIRDVYEYMLPTVSTPGELGTVANWEQHILPGLLERPGIKLEEALGEPLPDYAYLCNTYEGPVRVIVPTVRTDITSKESLSLDVLILSEEKPEDVSLLWRTFGKKEFQKIPVKHRTRGVYAVEIPVEETSKGTFEYYVQVQPQSGRRVMFPPSAPEINQTVVVTSASNK